MKALGHLMPVLIGAILLSGCMHTVVGNGNGVVSPDKRFVLGLEIHGASGKAYVDMSKKRVYLWIATTTKYDSLRVSVIEKSVNVLDKKYIFKAGDLCSRVQWLGSEEVTVDFYDFGDKIVSSDARKVGMASNHVATLAFALDGKTGKFSQRQ